ncbi:sensor histidine kinase [Paenibacillus septentrionalis]|uniref:histidine kinase n=1 Tax=Paenibacillus septentrionalis TaxID=429342 RepID=A0ABW1VAZ4_9BACL
MSYKLNKWLILIIPTVTIGLWEYIRHEFLLSYISMELGNLLSPIIVFIVTIVFLTKLFSIMERSQQELTEAKAMQDVLLEREHIAAELHDGIAQSLFLLNVQLEQAHREQSEEHYNKLKAQVHQTNAYVREAIASLRSPIQVQGLRMEEQLKLFLDELSLRMDVTIHLRWKLEDELLPLKERIDLLLSIREALHNIKKHADADHIWIDAFPTEKGWYCCVKDNGVGFDNENLSRSEQFGLAMVQERAQNWNWHFDIERKLDHTYFRIQQHM